MSETKRGYEVGRGTPPMHSSFKKNQSRNLSGRRRAKTCALLIDTLNEQVVVTANGRHRQVT